MIAEWAGSPSRTRRIAASWARELVALPTDTQVESSMKIASRFGVSNTMAVRARYLVTGPGVIRKSGRRYYVTQVGE
jgi:hypothetical protein